MECQVNHFYIRKVFMNQQRGFFFWLSSGLELSLRFWRWELIIMTRLLIFYIYIKINCLSLYTAVFQRPSNSSRRVLEWTIRFDCSTMEFCSGRVYPRVVTFTHRKETNSCWRITKTSWITGTICHLTSWSFRIRLSQSNCTLQRRY